MLIRHIGMVTQQIELMKECYKTYGLAEVSDTTEQVRIVKLKDDAGVMIELLQFESMSESVLRSKGISHVAFTTDNDDNYIEEVTLCPGQTKI